MLVNPVQQTPLAYDPARQILTPPVQLPVQPAQQPATPPVQHGDTPQDTFSPRDGGGSGGQSGAGGSSKDQAALADQLRAAYLRLQQLKEQASEALIAGDAKGAKDAAQQAAEVAVTIENITGSAPDSGAGPIEIAAQQLSAQNATSSESDGVEAASGSLPSVIDIARAGLGAAKDVVDTAASIPYHPIADRISIEGYMQTVLDAMAGVEAVAARISGNSSSTSATTSGSQVDINA